MAAEGAGLYKASRNLWQTEARRHMSVPLGKTRMEKCTVFMQHSSRQDDLIVSLPGCCEALIP